MNMHIDTALYWVSITYFVLCTTGGKSETFFFTWNSGKKLSI